MSAPNLDDLIAELEETAGRLRAGDLEQADAATLVDRCAELAGRVGAALDDAGREAAEGQGSLL